LKKNVTIDPELPCDYTQSISEAAPGQSALGQDFTIDPQFSRERVADPRQPLEELSCTTGATVQNLRLQRGVDLPEYAQGERAFEGKLRSFSDIDGGIG
jgi:hypothetical protein